jgi:uridine monophosphate synthetase
MEFIMLNSLFFLAALTGPLAHHHTPSSTRIEVMNHKSDLILKLYEIGAIKFGEFTLKSGLKSPIYFDLRVTISYPEILESIAICLNDLADKDSYDVVCGVPYAAVPIATTFSLETSKPLIMCRKEAKEHGTKKMVEGVFNQGDRVLVIEDVVTTGSSILETITHLENGNLSVQDVVVILDRQQGAKEKLASQGYNLHSIFTSNEVIDALELAGSIDTTLAQSIRDYLNN